MTTPTIPPGGGPTYSMVVQLAGSHIQSTPDIARIRLNGRHVVLGLDAVARASSGGADRACAVDLRHDGRSLLAGPLAVTATAVGEASMVNLLSAGGPVRPRVAAGGVLSVGLALSGTAPDYRDITLTLHLART